ncbi:hypothetical protein KJ885_03645 [Patescibacteria group bacterium]|nr:hypothetical protein [Patescibacteria group bacterium]
MAIITISKELFKKDDLVIIPRKEYEEFLCYRSKEDKESILTPFQKTRLQKARKNLAEGKCLTIYELKKKLGIKN